MINKIKGVEKHIYSLREDSPLAIPQIDPEKLTLDETINLGNKFEKMGVGHIAIGSSLIKRQPLQDAIDVLIKDFDFTIVTYISNTHSFSIVGKENRTAIYWMTIFNANNLYYLRDALIQGAPMLNTEHLEPIPTSYVFDDRDSKGTANWLSQPNLIPYDKPEISVSVALASQYLGIRFYIMAGGSNSRLPPSKAHVKAVKKNSNLFLIPTSGIKSESVAKELFAAGADALHLGSIIEEKNGLNKFERIFKLSKTFTGKNFLG